MSQKKIKKVVKGLKKASKLHAGQAKTLESIKMNKGGGAKSKTPSNVANPSIYSRAKAKASSMSKSQIKSAVKRKRAKPQGVGGKPTNVKTFAARGGMITSKPNMGLYGRR